MNSSRKCLHKRSPCSLRNSEPPLAGKLPIGSSCVHTEHRERHSRSPTLEREGTSHRRGSGEPEPSRSKVTRPGGGRQRGPVNPKWCVSFQEPEPSRRCLGAAPRAAGTKPHRPGLHPQKASCPHPGGSTSESEAQAGPAPPEGDGPPALCSPMGTGSADGSVAPGLGAGLEGHRPALRPHVHRTFSVSAGVPVCTRTRLSPNPPLGKTPAALSRAGPHNIILTSCICKALVLGEVTFPGVRTRTCGFGTQLSPQQLRDETHPDTKADEGPGTSRREDDRPAWSMNRPGSRRESCRGPVGRAGLTGSKREKRPWPVCPVVRASA